MRLKLFFCLLPFTLLNGSFTPVGKGNSGKYVNYQVRPDYGTQSIEDEIAEKMSIIDDMTKHEEERRLLLLHSHIAHNRTKDSLAKLIKNSSHEPR